MTKEELKAKIVTLELAIEKSKSDTCDVISELDNCKKQLENINKPELTPLQFDLINDAIEVGVGNFSFDEPSNYDKEFGMEYDGKVYLESIDLTCSYELVEKIVEQVHKLFTEAECPEDDSHPVEKLQN